uniref:Uncharacterized protein n=1 Tax=Ditylenchus dipsaci TaxID=166011 RepID=A0A915DXH3_9BILA
MCNYFYGIEYNYNYRLRVANECFDKTTPQRPVTKYVFNETVMSFRPVIITVLLHASKYYYENIAETLSTYLPPSTEFHSMSFVLSAMVEKTASDKKSSRYFQLPEWLLQMPIKASPRGSLVLWLSYSQSEIDRCLFWASSSGQSSLYSTSRISSQLTIFHTSTQELLFSKPSGCFDPN